MLTDSRKTDMSLLESRNGIAGLWLIRACGGLAAAAVAMLVACSGETTGTKSEGPGSGGSSGTGGGSSDGGIVQPNAECLAFCGLDTLTCTGPDIEVANSSSVTETSATGCSLTVVLPFSGTVEVEIDCTSEQACVEQASGCLGAPGECYPADFAQDSFSYLLENCINGSLSCWSD